MSKGIAAQRPDVYRYHDYRAFLKDWIAYRKTVRAGYSMRTLATEAKLASGYLPPVLSGARDLSMKALLKILPILGLNRPEQNYLESLVRLQISDSQEGRIAAVARMRRSSAYQRRNPNEAELFEYMSRWQYIAIREMAALPGFKADPDWIRSRLKTPVPAAEIEQALRFLGKHGYLNVLDDGTVAPPKEQIECAGGVYKVALTQYHRQMFGLAAESIDNSTAAERDLVGHTLVISDSKFEKARKILHEALDRIRDLGGATDGEGDSSVYHVELALFPLTKRGNV
jgi:uncharacterized protein (TIGR02147 family)